MKKSAVFGATIVVVAAAYTGLSWYVGMEAEKTIRTAVEQANERIGKTLGPDFATAGATISIDDYQRGVFASEARYRFVLQDEDDTIELVLQDDMQHGPFPWGALSQGSFTPLLAYSRSGLVDTEDVKRWFEAARGAVPLTSDTRIGFGGQGETVWDFAPLEWEADGDSLSFSGGRVALRFSNNMRDSVGEGAFASLVAGNAEGGETVSLSDIRLASNSATGADGEVRMSSEIQVAALTIDDMASESLAFEQLSMSFDSAQRNSLLDASVRYDLQRLLVGDIDLGSLSLGGQLENVDVDVFSALLVEYDAIAREHGAQEGEDFDLTPEDETRLLAKLAPALASSPKAALHPVSWRNDKGETTLSVSAALQPLPEGNQQAQEEALADALSQLRFELTLSRPMLLQAVSQAAGGDDDSRQFAMLAAMMFDAYVGRLERQGLVRREEDRVLLSVLYDQGELDVNGQPMSVVELMMLLEELGL